MAPQFMLPSEQAQLYTEILAHLSPTPESRVSKKSEVDKNLQANSRYTVNAGQPSVPSPRAQAIQRVQSTIGDLGREEVALVYNGGLCIEVRAKDFLCSVSRYFANALDGNFQEAATRIIRLRHDFPWAVFAMLDFFDSGGYHLYSRLREEYPHITMLDLHVHCYIIGDKYDISSLANYAAVNYLRIAADILSLDWQYDDPNYYDDSLNLPCVDYLPHDMCAAAEVSRFLDSTVILWRNTASRNDPLRKEVLEMIKACFIKLMRLKSFQFLFYHLKDFIVDIIEIFMEDGQQIVGMLKEKKGYDMILGSRDQNVAE